MSEDSLARQIARHQATKLKKKMAKKAAKAAAKLIKKLAVKFFASLVKVLLTFLGTIGLPEILIGLGIVVLFIVLSLSWSYLFGTGQGLSGQDKNLHDYIVQEANSTVDMNSALERPYRVPESLIASVVQIDAFQKSDVKSVIKTMAESLAPVFNFGKYDEWKEQQVTTCTDGKCVDGKIQRTSNLVSKLDSVDYWNGSTTFTYTPHVTDWKTSTQISYKTTQTPVVQTVTTQVQVPYDEEQCVSTVVEFPFPHLLPICKTVHATKTETHTSTSTVMQNKKIEIKTITKTRQQYFTSTSQTQNDYTTFDRILNSYNLGMEDKKLIELNYLFMGGQMDYTDWLQNSGGGDFGSNVGFDGTIIPGGGVPAQFMPFYLGAQKKYGVDWFVLAGVHWVETGFSTAHPMISSAGAIGAMQFMPATWAGWCYDIGGGLTSPSVDITSLAVISAGHGFGVDGDGDGKADPFDNADAIYTAANYLSKNGYAKDPRAAIYQYNHADWYVNKVLAAAERFKNAATYQASAGSTPQSVQGGFMRPAVGPVSSPFGMRGSSMHFGIDIAPSGSGEIPIVAAADGVVSRSYLSSSYGNCVFIKSVVGGQQYETVYAHMENRAVTEGQTVKQGQYLGNMGYTGDVQPPGPGGKHLHFEVHKGEWNVNKTNAINPVLVVHF